MAVGRQRGDAPARGALQVALLDQVGLDHVFDGVALLADAGSDVVQPHRATVETVDHGLHRAALALAWVASEIHAAPHARIMTFVRHAVGVIDAEYDRMMRTGDMKPINKSYKAARLAGVKLPPFGQFKEDYRMKMVRDAARSGILKAAFR